MSKPCYNYILYKIINYIMKNTNHINKLLSREDFKSKGFKRDNYTCVFCSLPAHSVHHIIERHLFPDGGYYLDNGASVCEQHHWDVEKTDISVEEVRKACGIINIVLPPHLDPNLSYDKWGNIILDNGMREPGEMFWEDNVQKILADKFHLFGF